MVKKKVGQLIKKHGTNDPFLISAALGHEVVYENLGSSLGYFSRLYRTAIIHINENLPYETQKSTCAHELGHILLHPEINTAFLKKNTYFPASKVEQEANEFMIELLFIQNKFNSITIKEATEEYGIPEQLLKKKFYP